MRYGAIESKIRRMLAISLLVILVGLAARGSDIPDLPTVVVIAPVEFVSARVSAIPTSVPDAVPLASAPARVAVRKAPRVPIQTAWAVAPKMLASASSAPQNSAVALLLLDDASGTVLYHEGGRTPLPPASLTKIATAILAIERGNLDEWVEVDVDSRIMHGSTVMGLMPGDHFTVRDLLYGLMLPSGNDAALAIGRHVAGSDAAFVEQMNELIARLGLIESHFANPHGLNATGHAASAHDLAMLARYAMTLPEFREIIGTSSWVASGSRNVPLFNVLNTVLYAIPGADGVKSGFTEQAGRTMVASALRDGHRLYVVVLNDPRYEADVAALLDWGFAAFDWSLTSAALTIGTGPG